MSVGKDNLLCLISFALATSAVLHLTTALKAFLTWSTCPGGTSVRDRIPFCLCL